MGRIRELAAVGYVAQAFSVLFLRQITDDRRVQSYRTYIEMRPCHR